MYKFVRTFKKPQKIVDNTPDVKTKEETNKPEASYSTQTSQTNSVSKTASAIVSNDEIDSAQLTEPVKAELSNESNLNFF